MAWDELGNDAPGRSVWTAKGSFVVQRLDCGWKVRGRNVMSKEWVYSLPSNIYIQALKRFRSLPHNCHHLHQTFLLPITPFQPFSSLYQTSATKQGARVKTRAATTPTGSRGNSQGTHCQAVGTWSAQSPSWKGGKANKPFWHFHVMDVLRDDIIRFYECILSQQNTDH